MYVNDDAVFDKNVLKMFFEMLSGYEKPILEKKLKNKGVYFQDQILENFTNFDKEIILDIEKYRKEYTEYCFGSGERLIKNISHEYLQGLQWVITYYKKGCPNWRYYYPYNYSPSASVLAKYILTFSSRNHQKTQPFTLFQQLISVLPPKSSSLLPIPLNKLLTDDSSPLKEFCPDKFEIDLAGKKREYQGVVKIPIINPDLIIKAYVDTVALVHTKDLKRNILGKTCIYIYCPMTSFVFNSFYGKIVNCKTNVKTIFL
jgi:5'-3' exoribonuclease 1